MIPGIVIFSTPICFAGTPHFTIRFQIFCYHSISSNNCSTTYMDSCNNSNMACNPAIISNENFSI